MAILKQARLVDSRKNGRWIYYRLADEEVPPEAAEATALATRLLSGTRQARDDAERLRRILEIDPEVLCKRQSEGRC
jgi:ArsR family transcriptional regulator